MRNILAMKLILSLCVVWVLAAAGVSVAQESAAINSNDSFTQSRIYDRLERLERDIILLQRQFFKRDRQSGASRDAEGGSSVGGGNLALYEVRISQIEEQLRQLNGLIEQMQYHVMQRTNADDAVEQRLLALEQAAHNASIITTISAQLNDDKEKLSAEEKKARKAYDRAFALLRQSKYDAAEGAFQKFTTQYKNSELIDNSYYWLGETHFIRKNYENAAIAYLKGYQSSKNGDKAPDNLLKLSLSLSHLDKKQEACTSLTRLADEFPNAFAAILQKGEEEYKRLGC